MYRNLNHRVEANCPVYDAEARVRLHEILDVMLRDHRNAWDLMPDGSYVQREPPAGAAPDSPEAAGVFETLMRRAAGHGRSPGDEPGWSGGGGGSERGGGAGGRGSRAGRGDGA
jgi:hypothetical protein